MSNEVSGPVEVQNFEVTDKVTPLTHITEDILLDSWPTTTEEYCSNYDVLVSIVF